MTTNTITFNGTAHTNASLEAMKGPELVSLYNLIADNIEEKGVKKFADHKTAVRRTAGMLVKFQAILDDEANDDGEEEAPEPTKAKPASKPAKTSRYKGTNFNFPLHDPKDIKKTREGTNRHILVTKLLAGATFDDCLKATDFGKDKKGFTSDLERKACYEAIRLLHYYVGYGMKQDVETSIIKLITK